MQVESRVGKLPWRRAWQPTPVFFPGESHGQRSLVGYNPWGRKESDTTERLLCVCVDCNLPGSSVREISQARILEWVFIFFTRGSSQPRDQTWVSCIAGGFLPLSPLGSHEGRCYC